MKKPYYEPRPEFLEFKRDWEMLRPYLYLLREKHQKKKGQE